MSWHPVNEVVYPSASKADAWEDLSLAAHVGAQRVVAVLKVTNSSARREIGFKAKGDGRNYDGLNFETAFGNNYQYVDVGDTALMISPTDAAGIVQWSVEGGGTAEVELVGYMDFTYDGSTAVGHSLTANTWTDYDFSSVITQDVLAFFVVSAGGGSADNYFAKYKTDPLTNWNATVGSCNYGASEGKLSWDADSMFSIPVKADGLIQLLSNVSGVTHTVTLIGFAPMTVSPTIIFDDVAPTSFTDQSAGVGTRSAFVYLATNQYEGSDGVNYGAYFKPNGNTETWVEGNSRGTLVYSDCTKAADVTHDCKQTIVVDDGIFEWQLGNPPSTFKTRLYTYGAILGPAVPIAHWPIDDSKDRDSTTVRDIVGGGSGNHDGVVRFGYYTYWQPGGVGGRHLGDVNTYGGETTVSNNPDDFRIGELTYMIWGACDQYSGWNDTITLGSCSHDNSGPGFYTLWCFEVVGQKLQVRWWDDVGAAWRYIKTTNKVVSRQGFQHFAFSRYEITPGFYGIRFYVDGVMVQDMDNGGAGYAGPGDGSSCIMYLCRRYDFILTYQSNLWYDSVRFYNEVVDDQVVADIYDLEVPIVRPTTTTTVLLPDIHESETTAEGTIYETQEISGDSHPNEAGVGGEEYTDVEAEPGEDRTDNVGDYDAVESGPLSIKERSGWWFSA